MFFPLSCEVFQNCYKYCYLLFCYLFSLSFQFLNSSDTFIQPFAFALQEVAHNDLGISKKM